MGGYLVHVTYGLAAGSKGMGGYLAHVTYGLAAHVLERYERLRKDCP